MADAIDPTFSPLRVGLLTLVCALAACASNPHVSKIHFTDALGDRGEQVFARDALWCAEAVESRRSQWNGCMVERGWRSQP